VLLAVVGRAHGLGGEVAVRVFNRESTLLVAGARLWLEAPECPGRWIRVIERRGDRLKLEGVDDRTQAEGLRGARLSVDRASFPVAAEDEFYLHDLIGAEVIDAAGRRLGVLEGLVASGSGEYFVIKGAGETLLPAEAPIVASVDLGAATVRLNVEVDPGLAGAERSDGSKG